MPYETLPARLREIIPSSEGQSIFRRVVNSQMAAGKTEEVAFASAWAALQGAGYEKGEDGKWMKKMQPTLSQVHVPGPMGDDDDDTDEKGRKKKPSGYMAKATYQPPESAKNNAQRVLDWREKYGNDVNGMTAVGWTRARQLASGKPISRDIVARMSAFNRHRKNAEVAPEHKGEPWKDAGHVAWLGWGGTSGVDWARSIMDRTEKRMMNDDSFTLSAEAAVRSMELGLNGDVHVHETADGQAIYMPGASHEDYLERMAELGGAIYDDEDDAEDSEEPNESLLERVISGMLHAAMAYDMSKSTSILKLDGERRIAWGWASVATVNGKLVTDTQGDVISVTEMSKMADRFMASARTAKAMHDGDQIGEVLHSFPLTNEIAKAFGLSTDREGWIIGLKINDEDTWQAMKNGTFRGFSIGGRTKRRPL